MTDQTDSPQPAGVLVLGMHRSGTSALTGALDLLGIPAAGDLLPAESYNEKGIFENRAVNLFHNRLLEALGSRWDDPMPVSNAFLATQGGERFVDELAGIIRVELLAQSPIFTVKDPRMSRFVPLWRAALDRAGARPLAVLPFRHPLEVVGSLARRDRFPRAKSLLLWLDHTLAAERETRGMRRSLVTYDGLLADWRGTVDRIAGDLDIRYPVERSRAESRLDSFLTNELRHHAAPPAIGKATRLDQLTGESWDAILRLVGDPEDADALARLDAVRGEIGTATGILTPYVAWEFRELAAKTWDAERLAFQLEAEQRSREENDRMRLEAEERSREESHRIQLDRERQMRSAHNDDRRALALAERRLERTENDLRAAIGETDRLRPSVHMAELLRHEIENLHREVHRRDIALAALQNSTSWRALQPLRAFGAYVPPGARTALRRSAKAAWWLATPWRMPARRRVIEALERQRQEALVAAPSQPAMAPPPPPEPPRIVREPSLLPERPPLRVFEAPLDRPRLSMVTDSINSGSLFGGVATALIFCALAARATGRTLRIVTRMQAPHAANVATILAEHDIPFDDNVQFAFCNQYDPDSAVDAGADEIFVTTSWWTTHATRKSIPAERILYLLQEDERMFYPLGDEHLLAGETMGDPAVRKIVNTELLFKHLEATGIVGDRDAFFEPAFPERIYHPEPAPDAERKRFFFYARPGHARNLFERGVAVIDRAIEENILDPDEWDIHFVGRSLRPMQLARSVEPVLIQDLAWGDYAAFVRGVDLGLSLMDTPHPSYPPLDIAASGGVVVTNRCGIKTDLSRYSDAILCADVSVDALVKALRDGVTLAGDRSARASAHARAGLARSWSKSFAGPMSTLFRDGTLVR
ncbi:hypothetical protein [Aureimonas jatrophae]|uniref:Uncharacterized protein n=1 Tax=Aureimonas jatrophae TaxID=1166073 RepID=A0A1H0CZI6_9HYPH|nr:hypothetical protein [Aureimonas jatrophae]MBB3949427.1 hypothetical protein [Aureimonas jatrophae]SDN63312.1 hypothetical protein SAMN05192530_101531 [Aureimonas jatrophae]